MERRQIVRTVGVVLLAVGLTTAAGTLLVRDQLARHQRNLFSPHPLRRFAALGHISGRHASVDLVRLLRDYVSWEPRPLLRKRAAQILTRMERRLEGAPGAGRTPSPDDAGSLNGSPGGAFDGAANDDEDDDDDDAPGGGGGRGGRDGAQAPGEALG
jgi:hypothetical protein